MFSVNVALGNVSWALVFNDEESATKAFNDLRNTTGTETFVDIFDDYGQKFHADGKNIQGVMFEDWNKTKLGHIERAIHSQRTQVEANKRWSRDPAAQAAGLVQGGGVPFQPLRQN